jgi:hypothetical protein
MFKGTITNLHLILVATKYTYQNGIVAIAKNICNYNSKVQG